MQLQLYVREFKKSCLILGCFFKSMKNEQLETSLLQCFSTYNPWTITKASFKIIKDVAPCNFRKYTEDFTDELCNCFKLSLLPIYTNKPFCMEEPLTENLPSKRKLCHKEMKAETLKVCKSKVWGKKSYTSGKGKSTTYFRGYNLSLQHPT